MKKVLSLLFFSALSFFSLQAQEATEEKQTESKKEVKTSGFYKPEVFGVLKVKYEKSLNGPSQRFDVRSSRLGVKGKITSNMSYLSQMELNATGKFTILDAVVSYQPFNFVDVKLGQQLTYFSSEVGRGPGSSHFSNRSLLAKYIMNYYYQDGDKFKMASLGPRDIGVNAIFKYNLLFPAKTFVGVFNGAGINNPDWSDNVNVNFRQEFGGNEGFKLSGSYYFGKYLNKYRTDMWDVEARYKHNNLILESEFAQQVFNTFEKQKSSAWVIQGFYDFKLPENKFAQSVFPVLRYDLAKDMIYKANTGTSDETVASNVFGVDDVQRITAGVNFRLTKKAVQAELRFQYEHYIMNEKPMDFKTNQLLQDKFTVEIVASF
ncbi:MAG: porin [Bacteroidales bacterium]